MSVSKLLDYLVNDIECCLTTGISRENMVVELLPCDYGAIAVMPSSWRYGVTVTPVAYGNHDITILGVKCVFSNSHSKVTVL